MARAAFFDNLRIASRSLAAPRVDTGLGMPADAHLAARLDSADLWLTPKSVEGFAAHDFSDWPTREREELAREVAAFLSVAEQVAADKPASKSQSKQARRHLERVIALVRDRLLSEWLGAQERLIEEAIAAANERGWHVDKDEKKVTESLLGEYSAPRLRIRTLDNEVVLTPIALFGSGRQGVVDLAVLPTFETAYVVTFKDGHWKIESIRGTGHSRPFSRKTLINTIDRLARR